MGYADVECAAVDPNPPDNGRAARAAPSESVATDDVELRALEAAAIAEHMRAFVAAWPDPTIVQRALHKLAWGVNVELLDAVKAPKVRLWYAERAFEYGWSRAVLSMHIERRLHACRSGLILHQIEDDLTRIKRRLEGDLATPPVAYTALEVA